MADLPDGSPIIPVKSPIKKNHRVAQVLKRPQLADHDRVAEVDVGRGRIDAEFDAQGFAGLRQTFSSFARSSSRG